MMQYSVGRCGYPLKSVDLLAGRDVGLEMQEMSQAETPNRGAQVSVPPTPRRSVGEGRGKKLKGELCSEV